MPLGCRCEGGGNIAENWRKMAIYVPGRCVPQKIGAVGENMSVCEIFSCTRFFYIRVEVLERQSGGMG